MTYSAFIVNPKFDVNRGSVERAVWNFGGDWIIRRGVGKGRPYTDVPKAHRHLPVIDLPDDPREARRVLRDAIGTHVLVAVDTRDVLARRGLGIMNLDELTSGRRRIPWIFMLGNEATGLPNLWLEYADVGVTIPMAEDRPGSLNVAVAGAIVLHHLQLGAQTPASAP